MNAAQEPGLAWRSPWRWLQLAPWLMLAVTALCWLRFGNDLPFVDDWRAYADGTAGRFVPRHWFTALNNTMAPVGLALDALAQRALGGNVVAYQFITLLAVQGGLLAGQWRLLRWALADRRQAVLAFAATAFMLQVGSYWGEQNMAYHQALPLLGLLGALCLLTTRLGAARVAVLAALLAVLAGLSYISGAVGAVVLSAGLCAMLALARPLRGDERRRAWALALGVLAGGAVAVAAQALAMRASHDVLGQHIPTTLPNQPAFWAYALGKLGRTLGQPLAGTAWDVALVAALWLAVAAALLALAGVAWAGRAEQDAAPAGEPAAQAGRVALVAVPLAGVLLAYLGMVAYGRASFHDAGVQTWLQVYRFGHLRFHHYWLTLIWPWALAAVAALLAMRRASNRDGVSDNSRFILNVNVAILGVLLLIGASRSVFDVTSFFRSGAEFRAGQWACLHQQWGSGEPIHCPIFDMPDATGALLHARQIGATFTRYLPLGAAVAPGRELLRWDAATAAMPGTLRDAQSPAASPGPWLRTGADAQWLLDFRADAALARALSECQVLDVAVQLQTSREGLMQVFFATVDAPRFEEHASRTAPLRPADPAHAEPDPPLSLQALNTPPAPPGPPPAAAPRTQHAAWESATGFAPQLRIDLADKPMWVRVAGLRLACRLPTLAAWRAAQKPAEAR